MNVGQDTVARCEQRSDMLLSTLRRYIAAAGGQLSLIAEFPGRPSVRLKGIGDTITESTLRRAHSVVARVPAESEPLDRFQRDSTPEEFAGASRNHTDHRVGPGVRPRLISTPTVAHNPIPGQRA